LTAIVSVADDGGSSGRLRSELGVAAPGDVRRCLSALASDDSLLARSLEFRFDRGSLDGHPIGNLLVTGLALNTDDLQTAIDEVGRLVGAVGRVLPATEEPVTLVADSEAGTLVGQVTIERASNIRDLRFDPAVPTTPIDAVAAVEAADQVIIGPGSLFTSVLAAAVVPDIRAALQKTDAPRIFVANVANDKGEARGFGLVEHVKTVLDHGVPIDFVVANAPATASLAERALSTIPDRIGPVEVMAAPVAHRDGWGHDPALLGAVLADLSSRLG
jgi:uncharacterized cofD-like protein